MLAVSSFVGAVVGLYSLWEIVIRRGPIRFAHFFCVANTVGYGFGALNSWLTISRGTMSLADFFNRDTAAVSHAMAAVLISSGTLYALGEIYERPIFGTNFRLKLDNRAAAFVFFGTALIIVGYATGTDGLHGCECRRQWRPRQRSGRSSGMALSQPLFAFTCFDVS